MPNTIFSEKVELLRIFLALLIIPGFFMIITPFVMNDQDVQVRIILPIVGVVMLILGYMTKSLDIVLTDEYLQFGFNIMRSKVNLIDIEEVRIDDFKFRKFGGYGIRISRMQGKKVVGYIPKGGKGLYIKTKKSGYFIISNRVDELQSLINDRIRIIKKRHV